MVEITRGTIADLESALVHRDFGKALDTLTSLLRTMDRSGGQVGPENVSQLSATFPQEIQEEAATRTSERTTAKSLRAVVVRLHLSGPLGTN